MMPTRRASPGDPLVAVAYIRVSTEDQKLGPEAQRAAIEAWASKEGVSVAAFHSDLGVSGGNELDDRPALVAAIGELRVLGAGVLVIAKRDRLARDVYVAATIERAVAGCGARVVTADGTASGDTPADAFMRTILDAAAAYERALIRARTKAGLKAKRARGEAAGTVPFGFRLAPDGVHLLDEPAERAVVKAARELYAQGGLSFRKVGLELFKKGMRSRTGEPFAGMQIYRMVKLEGPQ